MPKYDILAYLLVAAATFRMPPPARRRMRVVGKMIHPCTDRLPCVGGSILIEKAVTLPAGSRLCVAVPCGWEATGRCS
jgi:hypothetical protein